MEDAVSDFVEWEPGMTIICALCEHERGGDDPPRPWQRNYKTHRRRIGIYDAGDARWPMGYLEYIHR